MNATTLVKPVTCKRCKGKRLLIERMHSVHNGLPGGCYACHGAGVVEGDRETLRKRREADAAAEADGRRYGQARRMLHDDYLAQYGLATLMKREPERGRKAVESVLGGHPAVRAALAAYYRQAFPA